MTALSQGKNSWRVKACREHKSNTVNACDTAYNRFQTPSSRAARTAHEGFTLAEIIVVVVILTILAVIASALFLGQAARAQSGAARNTVATAASTFKNIEGVDGHGTARRNAARLVLENATNTGNIEFDTSALDHAYVWHSSGVSDMIAVSSGTSYDTMTWWCVEKAGGGDVWSMTPENTTPVNAPCDTSYDPATGETTATGVGGTNPPPPLQPPTIPVTVVKDGSEFEADTSTWKYRLDWEPSPEQVDGYHVYRQAGNYLFANEIVRGRSFDSANPANWILVGTTSNTSFTFTPDDVTGATSSPAAAVESNAGTWKGFVVIPYNAAGVGPGSNMVVIADGFRQGRGSWISCAVTTGPTAGQVKVVMQIPDTWNLPAPVSWQLRNSSGNIINNPVTGPMTGTATEFDEMGAFAVDVPSGVVLGKPRLVDGNGTVYYFNRSGTGTTNYNTQLANNGACPT